MASTNKERILKAFTKIKNNDGVAMINSRTELLMIELKEFQEANFLVYNSSKGYGDELEVTLLQKGLDWINKNKY